MKSFSRFLKEKWEDPRPRAKRIYDKAAAILRPNQHGNVDIPHNTISFIPHMPVKSSYFSQGVEQDRTRRISYPVQKIAIGTHQDDRRQEPDTKQHSLFKDTRPPRNVQTPLTHKDIDTIKSSERLKDVFAHEYAHHTDATKALMKGKMLPPATPPPSKKEKTRGFRKPLSMKKMKHSYYNDPTEVNAYTSDLFHMAKSSGLPPKNFKSPEDFRKLAIHKAFRTTDDRKYNYTRGRAIKYFTGKNRKKLMRRWRQETGVADAKAFPNPKPPKEKQLKLPLTGKDRMKLKRQKPMPAATTPRKPEQLRLPIDENRNNPMLYLRRKLNETAPPGAKYERMVKHIKANYSKDGKLTTKEKVIAFATAWKNKKKKHMKESMEMAAKILKNLPQTKNRRNKDKLIAKAQRSIDRPIT